MTDPVSFNPLDPAVRRDPFATYARARREAPALVHSGLPMRLVSVFRYEDCQAILRDAQTWSSEFPLINEAAGPGGAAAAQHARQRSARAHAPARAREQGLHAAHDPAARAAHARDRERAARRRARAGRRRSGAGAELSAARDGDRRDHRHPAGDRAKFKRWSDEAVANLGLVFVGGFDPERAQRQLRLFDAMREYFIPLAEERKRHPREDLLTGLVQAEHEGSKLDFEEMLSMLVLLLVAGNETTTTLIGNATLELLAHPGELKRLRDDPGLLPSAIEEVLRFASPVQFDPRRATRPLALHGVEIRENDFVLSWLGSANRDEQIFERPETLRHRAREEPAPRLRLRDRTTALARTWRGSRRASRSARCSRARRRFERRGDEHAPAAPEPRVPGRDPAAAAARGGLTSRAPRAQSSSSDSSFCGELLRCRALCRRSRSRAAAGGSPGLPRSTRARPR